MPGRFLTAVRPSKTLIDSAPYWFLSVATYPHPPRKNLAASSCLEGVLNVEKQGEKPRFLYIIIIPENRVFRKGKIAKRQILFFFKSMG
jgi:hypothetical protein